jgi:hypothetical protein
MILKVTILRRGCSKIVIFVMLFLFTLKFKHIVLEDQFALNYKQPI